jgi:hypothetical protein
MVDALLLLVSLVVVMWFVARLHNMKVPSEEWRGGPWDDDI